MDTFQIVEKMKEKKYGLYSKRQAKELRKLGDKVKQKLLNVAVNASGLSGL